MSKPTEQLCEFGTCTGGVTIYHHTLECWLGEDTENGN
jgi:hypothetical protein